MDVEEYKDDDNRTEEDSSIEGIENKLSNIRNTDQFNQRIKDKLEMMVDPEDMHIFTVEQSQKLYNVVTKQQKKDREDKERRAGKSKNIPLSYSFGRLFELQSDQRRRISTNSR